MPSLPNGCQLDSSVRFDCLQNFVMPDTDFCHGDPEPLRDSAVYCREDELDCPIAEITRHIILLPLSN